MLVLKIVSVLLGLSFTLFGYFIYLRKKYNLINCFEADFKARRKNEEYAKHVGMVEFEIGNAVFIAVIVHLIFT